MPFKAVLLQVLSWYLLFSSLPWMWHCGQLLYSVFNTWRWWHSSCCAAHVSFLPSNAWYNILYFWKPCLEGLTSFGLLATSHSDTVVSRFWLSIQKILSYVSITINFICIKKKYMILIHLELHAESYTECCFFLWLPKYARTFWKVSPIQLSFGCFSSCKSVNCQRKVKIERKQ